MRTVGERARLAAQVHAGAADPDVLGDDGTVLVEVLKVLVELVADGVLCKFFFAERLKKTQNCRMQRSHVPGASDMLWCCDLCWEEAVVQKNQPCSRSVRWEKKKRMKEILRVCRSGKLFFVWLLLREALHAAES